jgi:hypothetical protein
MALDRLCKGCGEEQLEGVTEIDQSRLPVPGREYAAGRMPGTMESKRPDVALKVIGRVCEHREEISNSRFCREHTQGLL